MNAKILEATAGPSARNRLKARSSGAIWIVAGLAVWFVLQAWVLPGFGIQT